MSQETNQTGFAKERRIVRFDGAATSEIPKPTATEYPLTIFMNETQLVTLLCSPVAMQDLAVGFLSSEGFLNSRDEIKSVTEDAVRGVVRVQTVDGREISQQTLSKRIISSGCGRGAAFYAATDASEKVVSSQVSIAAEDLLEIAHDFQKASVVYRETHAVHSAALYKGAEVVAQAEDVGRHNAVDKIFGRCLLDGLSTDDCMLVTSGRVSSEIAHKAARKGIPLLVSISAPTVLAVDVAAKMGITLVASVRGGKMDIYTHPQRITRKAE